MGQRVRKRQEEDKYNLINEFVAFCFIFFLLANSVDNNALTIPQSPPITPYHTQSLSSLFLLIPNPQHHQQTTALILPFSQQNIIFSQKSKLAILSIFIYSPISLKSNIAVPPTRGYSMLVMRIGAARGKWPQWKTYPQKAQINLVDKN